MAWSYDPALSSDKDRIRFLIQDNDTDRQLFQDEEILWLISTEANIYMAAAALCDQLVIRGGGVKYKKVGDMAAAYSVDFYRSTGAMMRSRGSGHQVPYAGGISVTGKQAQQADTDAVKPSVFKGLGENPAAPAPQIPPNNPLTTV